MKPVLTLLSVIALLSSVSYSQRQTVNLTFTAELNGAYLQLNSAKVINLNLGNEAMTYWPDTVLTMNINPGDLLLLIGYAFYEPVNVSETDQNRNQFELSQVYPNPVRESSTLSVHIPEAGYLEIIITDQLGRRIATSDRQLSAGNHLYRFTPGNTSLYFMTVRWKDLSRTLKVISQCSDAGSICNIEYMGDAGAEPQVKQSLHADFVFQESGILDSPSENTTYTFQFATNIPCPGIPTVSYGGQVYNTLQIFSQCWLKENLNLGTMIQGSEDMTDNDIFEKYCYNDDEINCNKYGGLYQWNEVMQYTTIEGSQGICPPGWHVPSDQDWNVLEGAVDSQVDIGDPEWDLSMTFRGFDAGINLKSTTEWYSNGDGTDIYGFSGLPGGYRETNNSFYNVTHQGYWYTSTMSGYPMKHGFYGNNDGVYRGGSLNKTGLSLRCIKDY